METEEILTKIGLDIPTVVRMLFKAIVRENRIPFDLSATSHPDMTGIQFILPDKDKARGVLQTLQKDGYSAEMICDPDGWRIRMGA